MNLAALWKLPVLFLCENNLYAMGTALARSESQTDIQAKAARYASRAQAVDGMDVFAVEAAVRSAADHARAAAGRCCSSCRTYRFRAHSMFDAQLYRDKAEVEEWRRRGPLITLPRGSRPPGLMTEDDFLQLLREADAEVQAAVAFAEQRRGSRSRNSRATCTRRGCAMSAPAPRIDLPRGREQAIRDALAPIRACS